MDVKKYEKKYQYYTLEKKVSIDNEYEGGVMITNQLLYQLSYKGRLFTNNYKAYISYGICRPLFFWPLYKEKKKNFVKVISNQYFYLLYFFYIWLIRWFIDYNKGLLTIAIDLSFTYNQVIININKVNRS